MAATANAIVPAIELRNLTKDFAAGVGAARVRAVDGLSLSIAPGQIYGLLGPNGCGKSTTIKIVLGLLRPTQGEARIFGLPSADIEARLRVGYLPEAPHFYRHLSGRELVAFCGELCGLRGPRLVERVTDVIRQVGLASAGDRKVGTYSKGMLQRIGLAQALVHEPQLLILDEPTAGVDPVGTADITALLRELRGQGKTILITSHLLAHMEEICDRIAILDQGRVVIEGTVADLLATADEQIVTIDALPTSELSALEEWIRLRGGAVRRVDRGRTRLDRLFLERVSPRAAGADEPGRQNRRANDGGAKT